MTNLRKQSALVPVLQAQGHRPRHTNFNFDTFDTVFW